MIDLLKNVSDGIQYIVHFIANTFHNFMTLFGFVADSSEFITDFFSGLPTVVTLLVSLLIGVGVLQKVSKWR